MDAPLRRRPVFRTAVIAAAFVLAALVLSGRGTGGAPEDPFEGREMPFDWRSAPASTASTPGRAPDQTMGQALEDALAEHADELVSFRVRSSGASHVSRFSVRLVPREGLATDDLLALVDDVRTAFSQNLPPEATGEHPSVNAVLKVLVERTGVMDVPMALEITGSGQPADHGAEARVIDAARTVDTRGARSAIVTSEGVVTLTYPDEDSLREGMVALVSAPPTGMRSVVFRTETRRWKVRVVVEPGDPSAGALPGMVGRILDAHDPWIPQLADELELHTKGHVLTVGGLRGDEDGPDADTAVDILRAADDCGRTPVVLHAGDATHPTGYLAYACVGGRLEVDESAALSSAFTKPVNNPGPAADLLEEARR
ncbi:hypothetical protein [Actinomyces marmotae]|uniref:Uncharacterized protein n=1 Tax=Actinomyces marmotae TaxID=2737173 RepID=A0A6M8B0F9_9ACTO|nr:hypothetical protein [Actinomyces marmotae]QKD80429.1 hypothetical protein HPC72_09600 [Actinomyces marmotae]